MSISLTSGIKVDGRVVQAQIRVDNGGKPKKYISDPRYGLYRLVKENIVMWWLPHTVTLEEEIVEYTHLSKKD
jgi:hypothetical protein